MYRPQLKEETELEEKCTFHPDISASARGGLRSYRAESGKENCNWMSQRRTQEEFLRDQRVFIEKKQVKIDMMQEQKLKEE